MKKTAKWKSRLRELANEPAMSSILGNAIGAILSGTGTMIYNKIHKKNLLDNVARNGTIGALLGGGIGFGASYLTRDDKLTPSGFNKRISALESKHLV